MTYEVRKAHIKRIHGKSGSKDTLPEDLVEELDVWLDVWRPDEVEVFQQDQRYIYRLKWLDTPEDELDPVTSETRKVTTKKVVGPDEDPKDPSVWVPVELVDSLVFADSDEYVRYWYKNKPYDPSETPAEPNDPRALLRDMTIMKVNHWDTTPSEDKQWVDQLEYERVEDTEDTGQYVYVEVPKRIATNENFSDGQYDGQFAKYRKRDENFLAWMKPLDVGEEVDRTRLVKLDPWQQIVNCQFNTDCYFLYGADSTVQEQVLPTIEDYDNGVGALQALDVLKIRGRYAYYKGSKELLNETCLINTATYYIGLAADPPHSVQFQAPAYSSGSENWYANAGALSTKNSETGEYLIAVGAIANAGEKNDQKLIEVRSSKTGTILWTAWPQGEAPYTVTYSTPPAGHFTTITNHPNFSRIRWLVFDKDNNLYAGGLGDQLHMYTLGNVNYYGATRKYNSEGGLLWEKIDPETIYILGPNCSAINSNSDLVVSATHYEYGPGSNPPVTVFYDVLRVLSKASGDTIAEFIPDYSGGTQNIHNIICDAKGSIYAGGNNVDSALLMKFDNDLNILWSITSFLGSYFYSVDVTKGGHPIVMSDTNVTKYNSLDGTQIWTVEWNSEYQSPQSCLCLDGEILAISATHIYHISSSGVLKNKTPIPANFLGPTDSGISTVYGARNARTTN